MNNQIKGFLIFLVAIFILSIHFTPFLFARLEIQEVSPNVHYEKLLEDIDAHDDIPLPVPSKTHKEQEIEFNAIQFPNLTHPFSTVDWNQFSLNREQCKAKFEFIHAIHDIEYRTWWTKRWFSSHLCGKKENQTQIILFFPLSLFS